MCKTVQLHVDSSHRDTPTLHLLVKNIAASQNNCEKPQTESTERQTRARVAVANISSLAVFWLSSIFSNHPGLDVTVFLPEEFARISAKVVRFLQVVLSIGFRLLDIRKSDRFCVIPYCARENLCWYLAIFSPHTTQEDLGSWFDSWLFYAAPQKRRDSKVERGRVFCASFG